MYLQSSCNKEKTKVNTVHVMNISGLWQLRCIKVCSVSELKVENKEVTAYFFIIKPIRCTNFTSLF